MLSGATTAVFLFGAAIFQLWTVVIVYRRFVGSRRISSVTEIGDLEAATFFRVLAFGIYVFVGLMSVYASLCRGDALFDLLTSICVISTNYSTHLATDLITAACGPTLFLTFATEDSVLRAWGLKAPLPVQGRSDSTVSMNQARRQLVDSSPQIISNGPPSSISRVLASFNFPNPSGLSRIQANDHPQSLSPQPVVSLHPLTTSLTREPPIPIGFLLTSEPYIALESPATPTEPHHTMFHHSSIP